MCWNRSNYRIPLGYNQSCINLHRGRKIHWKRVRHLPPIEPDELGVCKDTPDVTRMLSTRVCSGTLHVLRQLRPWTSPEPSHSFKRLTSLNRSLASPAKLTGISRTDSNLQRGMCAHSDSIQVRAIDVPWKPWRQHEMQFIYHEVDHGLDAILHAFFVCILAIARSDPIIYPRADVDGRALLRISFKRCSTA